MKQTDKNIIMITSGGVGQRFGAGMPKQYVEIDGRQVIGYVIEACRQSRLADAILVVAHPQYHDELRTRYGVEVTASGAELNDTKRAGLEYLHEHSGCERLVVVDAVRPAVEAAVIDRFFSLLDDYDAVANARKITDSLGCYDQWIVDRERFYTLSTPEAFRFPMFYEHFRADSPLTESIQQLPQTARICLDFDAPYYDKLTYPEDLAKIQAVLRMKM